MTATARPAQQHESFAEELVASRDLLFATTKDQFFRSVLTHTGFVSSAGMNEGERPRVNVNRMQAFRAAERVNTTERRVMKTMFGQLMAKLRSHPTQKLRRPQRAWKIDFVGEGSIDAGGPYHESVSQLGTEMMSAALPLFADTPNARDKRGTFRSKMMPRPSSKEEWHKRLYEFAGKLMGVALRTQKPLNLNLPSLMWKRLVGEALTMEDLNMVDEWIVTHFKAVVHSEGVVDNETFAANFPNETYTVVSCEGEDVELVPGGASIPVTFDNRLDYVRKAVHFRLSECDAQIDALRRGIGAIVPTYLLALFTGAEIEYLVCGSPEVDVALLKKTCQYDGPNPGDPHVNFFWKVLEEDFNTEDRVAFLRFVSGRTRLPNRPEDMVPSNCHLKLSNMSGNNPDSFLPLSHTCFFQLELPRYSTREVRGRVLVLVVVGGRIILCDCVCDLCVLFVSFVGGAFQIMCNKLKFAAHNCFSIDTDNSANRDAWNLEDDDDDE